MSNEKKSKMPKAMKIITSFLCVILGLILIGNLTIIIKGALNPDRPPSVLGFTSMATLSGSMSGDAPDHIEVGDLIIAKSVDPDKLKVGDVITYMENGKTAVTHRIVKINSDGTFTTKGDANNTQDQLPVKKENVIGKLWLRIPKMGDAVMFAQTPVGMLVVIGVPIILYILLDIFLRARQNKRDKLKEEEEKSTKESLEKELAQLKAMMNNNAEMQNAEENNEEMQNAECRNKEEKE